MTRFPRHFRHASRFVLVVTIATLGVGGCGDEPSQFPKPPSLGPAPAGGSTGTSGNPGSSMGNLPSHGGDGDGGSGGPEGGETSNGGSAPAGSPSTGGTTAGTTSGGTGGTGGTDPNPLCGNNQTDDGEECDDGNRESGDGCSSQCQSKCEACESVTAAYWNAGEPANASDDWYDVCYHDETLAEAGPAAGVSRSILCHDLVECVRSSGCLKFAPRKGESLNARGNTAGVLTSCFCQNELAPDVAPSNVPDSCYDATKIIKGPCYAQMLEAAEGDATTSITAGLTRASLAIGRAYRLFNDSDWLWCKEQCLPLTCEESGGCLVCDEEEGTCELQRVCTPGAMQVCVGSQSCSGEQECLPSGSGWRDCECAAGG